LADATAATTWNTTTTKEVYEVGSDTIKSTKKNNNDSIEG
jgi:hypothetical protein